MDIKQAKQELRRAVLSYGERTLQGQLCIPLSCQRPLLLMGPPGVGKTAILYQLAQELDVGLVAYTMTHHTRQSALGLPQLREKTYKGASYTVTEYTMSEILAAVYEHMEQTGHQRGILFLDEINCVSETLMPAMLQLLQTKQFGTHRLPEGWMIVAAGNPPQYNQSARLFDTVTMDRVRLLEITEQYDVWREYAHNRGLHPAILSYLELNPEHFYHVEPHAHGRSFVTARAWEDLSHVLFSYERLGFSAEQTLFGEYLQHPEIAASFAAYFRLYTGCCQKVKLPDILSGLWGNAVPEFQTMPFPQRIAAVEFLLHGLGRELAAWQSDQSYLGSLESFLNALAQSQDPLAQAKENLIRREHALQIRKECGVLSETEEKAEKRLIGRIRELLEENGCDALRQELDQCRRMHHNTRKLLLEKLNHAISFVRQTFAMGQELLIFLSRLESLPGGADFLKQTEHAALMAQLVD